ncbi:MAG: hypothetical protein IT529_09240 [Burkholderiales bacterium]|nr:hypothetical protein [Burkholderiales bacterium]
MLFAVALAGAALHAWTRAPRLDTRHHGEVLGWLRELKALDARWDVEALRGRIEFAPDARPSADTGAEVKRLRDAIAAAAVHAPDPQLKRGLEALVLALARKADLVEKFRNANTVTRHALARVLAAETETAGLVRGSWAEFKDRERLVAVESTVAHLLAEAQRYYHSAADSHRRGVEATAGDLRAAAGALPPALKEGLGRLDANVQQLLGAKPIEEALYEKLAVTTAGPRVDGMSAAYSAALSARLAERELRRAYLTAVLAAVLVGIAWLALRLAAGHRDRRRAAAELERRSAASEREIAAAHERLREVEAQLVQTEKLSTLGRMVAGIAHEVATPLAYVKGGLETVRGRLPAIARVLAETDKLVALIKGGAEPAALARQLAVVQAHAAEIEQRQVLGEMQRVVNDGHYGIDRISDIVASLRNFARADRGRMASFDLNEGLQSTLAIARHELKRHVVERHYGEIPPINCSPSQINQVLLNLVNNAARSIESGRGTIRLTTRREDEGHVAVEIEDNGRGIPPDVLPRIFDAFFTTRGDAEGTGLGLSISRRIVEEHGGRITVDSAVGIGTKFRVVLPVNPPAAGALAA